MRKIKKFKIPIYSYDILRKAKKRKIDLFALGLAAQEDAKEYIASIAALIEPATVFDFVEPEDQLAKDPGPFAGGSLTLGLITLGAPFADRLAAIRDQGHFALAETAAVVFGDTGLKVITELIAQESGMEGFEPGQAAYLFACPEPDTDDPAPPAPPEAIAAALSRLQADKIGVRFENGALIPKYSLLFALPWVSRKKTRSASAKK
ncbi:MAG: hypothetical protein A3J79_04090 [Elusimicrobia bacterium RIFOXYB2_FULL_62_6]|nr:MAG: hypothetical protein A3J79_04090 [Elusimicrobia bacterium RIFOXYB2_FULL_62_6]